MNTTLINIQTNVLETINYAVIICVLDPGFVLKVNFNFSFGAEKLRSRETNTLQ